MNTQLLRSSPKEDKSSAFHVGSYTGASYSEPEKHHFQKVMIVSAVIIMVVVIYLWLAYFNSVVVGQSIQQPSDAQSQTSQ